MNDWTEELFLERLMPLMRQEPGVAPGNCPATELLCAFAEDRTAGAEKSAMVTHLAGCTRCRELHARLVRFAAPAAREDDREWDNAEKRLDIWMESVLSRERAHTSPRPQGKLTARTNRANWWSAWTAQWAVGAEARAGGGGDVIHWVMRAEAVSFRHAVELLRRDYLPSASNPSQQPPRRSTVPKLPRLLEDNAADQELLQIVSSYYHDTLKQTTEAQQYLIKCGLQSAEIVDRFIGVSFDLRIHILSLCRLA